MRVTFQPANPDGTNSSYYIKFDDGSGDKDCILVDIGPDTDPWRDLSNKENLKAILVTHSHRDHYKNLTSDLDAPVITSPQTATILEVVAKPWISGESAFEDVRSGALYPTAEWETITDKVAIRPFTVGHTIGAAGFAIRFETKGGTEHIVCTGDFTFHPVCGNQQMPMEFPFEVGALFCNVSVEERHPLKQEVGDSLKKIIEATFIGGNVLVAVDGIAGIHYARLLNAIVEGMGGSQSIAVVGRVAKVYQRLYDDDGNITCVTEYTDPNAVVNNHDICIAGPSEPHRSDIERRTKYDIESSTVLFDVLRDDPQSTIVQVHARYGEAVTGESCMSHRYQYTPHPTQSQIDEFVSSIAPRVFVPFHGEVEAYGDRYDSAIEWSDPSATPREFRLYDHGWESTPGMSQEDRSLVDLYADSEDRAVCDGGFGHWNFELDMNIADEVSLPDTKMFTGV